MEQDDDLRGRSMAALPRLALWAMKHARHGQDFVARMYQWADVFREMVQAPSGVQALAMLLRYILQVSDADPDEVATFTTDLGKAAREVYMTGAEVLEQRVLRQDRRHVLETLLQKRFGALPQAVVERLQQASPEEMWPWIERVVTAGTLDEVFDDPADTGRPVG